MSGTLIVINPHAGGQQAGRVWEKYEGRIREKLGDLTAVVTQDVEELPAILSYAAESGIERIIALGGDGTNHSVVNAILAYQAAHPGTNFTYGMLPAGTGRDWARGLGIPLNHEAAIDWLAAAQPQPIDLGFVEFDGQSRYFVNISSSGISNDVVQRVASAPQRRPWTFFQSILGSLMFYRPEPVQIWCDERMVYEGDMYIMAVANGTTFAQGMQVAPYAQVQDGLLDVVVVEGMPLPNVLWSLPRIYRGTHATHPQVHMYKAQHVRIVGLQGPLGMDLDGEPACGQTIDYSVMPQHIMMLKK